MKIRKDNEENKYYLWLDFDKTEDSFTYDDGFSKIIGLNDIPCGYSDKNYLESAKVYLNVLQKMKKLLNNAYDLTIKEIHKLENK